MDAYRAVVDKRDQRAFLDKPIPDDIDPARSAPPAGVARHRLPLSELVHDERW